MPYKIHSGTCICSSSTACTRVFPALARSKHESLKARDKTDRTLAVAQSNPDGQSCSCITSYAFSNQEEKSTRIVRSCHRKVPSITNTTGLDEIEILSSGSPVLGLVNATVFDSKMTSSFFVKDYPAPLRSLCSKISTSYRRPSTLGRPRL